MGIDDLRSRMAAELADAEALVVRLRGALNALDGKPQIESDRSGSARPAREPSNGSGDAPAPERRNRRTEMELAKMRQFMVGVFQSHPGKRVTFDELFQAALAAGRVDDDTRRERRRLHGDLMILQGKKVVRNVSQGVYELEQPSMTMAPQ
jgi:hypothetical protein